MSWILNQSKTLPSSFPGNFSPHCPLVVIHGKKKATSTNTPLPPELLPRHKTTLDVEVVKTEAREGGDLSNRAVSCICAGTIKPEPA